MSTFAPMAWLGVRSGSIVYTYPWQQVKAVRRYRYGRGYSVYTVQLVGGKELVLKHIYDKELPRGLDFAIERILANYRTQQQD